VLAPKVDGLAVLVRLLGDAPLDLVALLGSISAVAGSPGQCDYAAANAALDAFVEAEARPAAWRRVVAVDYAAWRDVGMAARTVVAAARREAWEEHLRSAIAPAQGADAFARALASGRARLVVAPFDLLHALDVVRQQGLAPATAGTAEAPAELPASTQERPAVSTPYEAPETEVERRLGAIWSELLGVERIGAHDDFFELGGHSLMATRMLARVDQALAARLALRDVFDAPTIHRLAEKITRARASAQDAAPAPDREELEF
jgi:hypothetical protein